MSSPSPSTFIYANPHQGIQPGNLRDPYILRVHGRYYLTGTLPPFWHGPCPGVPLWSSNDLLTWTRHELLVDRSTLAPEAWYRARFWAPEIHPHDGAFFLTFNARNAEARHKHMIAIARAEQITGPYRVLNEDQPLPPVKERHHSADAADPDRYVGNDASLFTDLDGASYLFWCHIDGIWGQRIDLSTAQLVGQRFATVLPVPGTWESLVEGPCVRYWRGWYYCFYSGYGRSYEVGVVRARSITGSWVKQSSDPIMSPRSPMTHAGHNGVFTGPDGRWWLCYHTQYGKDTEERLAYDPLEIDMDGTVRTEAPTTGPRSVALHQLGAH